MKNANTLGPALVVTVVMLSGCAHQAATPRPFDSATWKVQRDDFRDKTRCSMVDSLLKDHELKGMSEAEVVALLGSQDDSSHFKSWDLRYWMGAQHDLLPAVDSEWLVIRFKESRVSEYAIVTD